MSRSVSARRLAPVAAASAATTVWLSLLGLVSTPFLIRNLGQSAYAVFALLAIMTAYLANLEFGFGHATVRFLARARATEDPAAQSLIIGTSLTVFVCAALLASALVIVLGSFIGGSFANFPPSLDDEAITAIRLGGAAVGLALLANFMSASLQAYGQFAVLIGTKFCFGTLGSVSAIATAAAFADVGAVLLSQVIVQILNVLVMFIALSRASVARIRPAFDWVTSRRWASSGLRSLGLVWRIRQ